MTVVAYKEGVMASDSMISLRETGDKLIFGPKVCKIGSALVGASGSAQILRKIKEIKSHVNILNRISSILDDDEEDHDFDIMVLLCGKKFVFDNSVVPCEIYDEFFAIGSGSSLALGAMSFGASAEEAVRVAIKHNVFCGGEVYSVSLE